jgi:hypothetical protein
MPGIFVSHAGADKELVDKFVDYILVLGCEVPKNKIFYSSRVSTGVPSGQDLNSFVQKQVADAAIVIAILTPTYQTRPYCIAELGAAWSRIGHLFPVAVSGMQRSDLQGVLQGLVVRYLDDSAALDELHETVCTAVGSNPGVSNWNTYKAEWMAEVGDLVASLDQPRVIAPEEFDRLQNDRDGALRALRQTRGDNKNLHAKIEQLKKLKDKSEVRRILKPENEIDEYEMLEREAIESLRVLPRPARAAVYWDMKDSEMPWPNAYEDQWEFDQAEKARVGGWLEYGVTDESLTLNQGFGKVRKAITAVREFQKFLSSDDRSESFHDWFDEEHDEMPPDLRNKALWDKIFDIPGGVL